MTAGNLEAIAYKMQPAGHDAGHPRRKYSKSSSKLARAFEKWLNSHQNDDERLPHPVYTSAEELLNSIDANIDEAHSLVIKNQDNPGIANAGFFLSCIYNKSNEKQIVYDLNVPLSGIGYKLPENKSLINKTHGSHNLGHQAAGVIVNYGNYERENSCFAFNSSGIFVNYGEIKGELGRNSTGYIINCGDFHGTFCPMSRGLGISLEGIAILPANEAHTAILVDYDEKGYAAVHGHRGIECPPEDSITAEESKVLMRVNDHLTEMKKDFAKGKEDYNAVFDALKKYPKDEVRQYLVNAIAEAYKCKVKH